MVHSFEHSMRDRLRAVESPFDVIDQIGGWSTAGVGSSYGNGYSVEPLDRENLISKSLMASTTGYR